MTKTRTLPALQALLAAVLYGMNVPFAKLLARDIDPLYMAAFLYLGAGIGMSFLSVFAGNRHRAPREARLNKTDCWNTAWMILLDIAAPIFLMLGLKMTNAATVSLLGNFEIVATSAIALIVYREAIGRRMWLAIALVSVSCTLLTIEEIVLVKMSAGSLLVLLACICWGFENNCTRNLSLKDPRQIVVVKGLGSGFGALVIAMVWGVPHLPVLSVLLATVLGFFAYGISITFYVTAQRQLGAARTSAYYAAAPFIGILLSWLVLKEAVSSTFFIALGIMVLGTVLVVSENHAHEHRHNGIEHDHRHTHDDGHHDHEHGHELEHGNVLEHENEHDSTIRLDANHSHMHRHEAQSHSHAHVPDSHHRHGHTQQ